jgi:hypothetical protein
MRRSLFLVYGLTLGLAGLEPVHASVLYNNLPNPPSSILGNFPIGSTTGAGPEGDSFSTGASPTSLTDVVLALQGVHDSDSFAVSLYSDNHTVCAPGPTCTGGPLTLLDTIASVSDNSIPTTLTDVNFALTTPYALAANTRYWIIASSTSNSGTLWSYTEDLSGTGVAGEFNIDYLSVPPPIPIPNTNDYSTYPDCANGTLGPSGEDSCTPFQMEVITTPEPGTLGLGFAGLGLAGLVGWLRGRKNSRKMV